MTKNELLSTIAAVLTTALEIQPCPETMCYLALGSDMSKWETIKHALMVGGLATFVGHSVTLTPKGADVARQCNAVLASR